MQLAAGLAGGGFFGKKPKNKVTNKTKNSFINQTVFDVMMKNENIVQVNTKTIQKMNLSNVNAVSCVLKASQIIDTEVKTVQQIDNETRLDMISDMQAKIMNKLKSDFKQTSGFGGGLTSKQINLLNSLENEIKNVLETDLTVEKINKNIIDVKEKQDMTVKDLILDPCGLNIAKSLNDSALVLEMSKLCTPKPDCTFDQNIIVTITAEQIASEVVDVISKNKSVNDAYNKLVSEVTIKDEGIGDALKKALSALTGPVLLFAFIFFVIIVGILYFVFGGGSDDKMPNNKFKENPLFNMKNPQT